MDIIQGRVFHKPEMGTYYSTIIDVVSRPKTDPTKKDKIRIEWALISSLTGKIALGPDGEQVFGSAYVSNVMNSKSTTPLYWNLYGIIRGVLGTTPPLITKFEELENLLMGRSNVTMWTKEPNPNKVNEFYSNIVGITPLPPGAPVPVAPEGYMRYKGRPQTSNAAPTQYVTPSQPVPQQVVVAPAPVTGALPTPEQIAAFLASQAPKNNTSF
jgi:hypothetical protein